MALAKYLANQIYKGKLAHEDVIALYANLKDEIDQELERLNNPEESDE